MTAPIANLLVIRSDNIDRAVLFYQAMGMSFDLHSHGKGPKHYVCETAGFVFEIYPKRSEKPGTEGTRLGFRVNDVEQVVGKLREIQATIVTEPANTEWGRRAVAKDFDGHAVELVTPVDS